MSDVTGCDRVIPLFVAGNSERATVDQNASGSCELIALDSVSQNALHLTAGEMHNGHHAPGKTAQPPFVC